MHVDCISSRIFYNKNVQEKHKYLCQRVSKSTAVSWFYKSKVFQHIVPNLSYAQVLAKGSKPNHTVSLDKKPYQHMVHPIFNNKVKKGVNPNVKISHRSGGFVDPLTQKFARFKARCLIRMTKKSSRANDQ